MEAEVRRFCDLIERAEDLDQHEFADDVRSALIGVVAAVLALPEVAPTTGDLPGLVSQEEWGRRFSAVLSTLGEWDGYWTTNADAEVGDEEPEALYLTLADDLADIWRDLLAGVRALDSGSPREDVLWQWQFDFRSHWGAHAFEALRALHVRLAT